MSTLNNVDRGVSAVTKNVNVFLKQIYEKHISFEVIETYELYSDIGNEYLRNLFAILHQKFNELFGFMYRKTNGHFNAEESRQLLEYIKVYDDMQYVLKNTSYSFEINKEYKELIDTCRDFLLPSGGSPIPNDLKHIYLIEYGPIFTMNTTIKTSTIKEEKKYGKNTWQFNKYIWENWYCQQVGGHPGLAGYIKALDAQEETFVKGVTQWSEANCYSRKNLLYFTNNEINQYWSCRIIWI